jgi:hypothetical protein
MPDERRDDTNVTPESVITSKRRRLGTALHQLAVELARERRRTAELERELASLRSSRPRRD